MMKFGLGTLVGATVGTAAAFLLAPQQGSELQRKISNKIKEAKLAGEEAQAAKHEELIRQFQGTVDDPSALEGVRAKSHEQAQAAAHEIRAGMRQS